MTFRTKLLLVTSCTIAGAVALVTGAVSLSIRGAFEKIDASRRAAVLDRFNKELAAQGEDVARKAERVAASQAVLRLAVEANRAEPDFSAYVNEAQELAGAFELDFLDIADSANQVITSAHYPARFGYQHEWAIGVADAGAASFLTRIPAQEGPALALGALRRVSAAGGKSVHVLAGRRIDAHFLASLEGAPGSRVLLWRSEHDVVDARGPVADAGKLAPLISEVRSTRRPATQTVRWTADRASSESLHALPLEKDGALLAVLLVATPLRDQIHLERSILFTGLAVGATGILLGVLLGVWTTARVTRPVGQLVAGARAVAAGDWSAKVAIDAPDEIGELARAFNQMTGQLIAQRDRAVQAERVAAWRELARRLAHELKNPLFPLQITLENLRKAHEVKSPDFEAILNESTATLLAELANLKTIIGRFSDFAKMPAPQFEDADLNAIVRDAVRLHQGVIQPQLDLAPGELRIEADPEQIRRMLGNLILNARDAMPDGGTLRITTERIEGGARLTVSDTGSGLTREECDRLFTPYYTTKQHGTGLGLAIVQSVVSDHRGRIDVASEPGQGTTFTIDLPARRDG